MKRKLARSEHRTEQEIREHYEIEKDLANQLRTASRNQRRILYTSLYEELYRKVPNMSLLEQKHQPEELQRQVDKQMPFLNVFIDKDKTFLEVGPGNCALSFYVSGLVREVYAVDVSESITHSDGTPENFSLIISDGCSIPVPVNSIDIVYSNQLMEHLHPDDAKEQIQNIFKTISPGGVYLCCTPNRLNGPHDISYYFDDVATGFHLKEYTIAEISKLFKEVGFSEVLLYTRRASKECRQFPLRLAVVIESFLSIIPGNLRQLFFKIKLIKRLMKIHIVGVKQR